MKTKIDLSADVHQNKKVVLVQFDYNTTIADVLKQNFPAHWSQSKKYWWIERKRFNYSKIKKVFSGIAEKANECI